MIIICDLLLLIILGIVAVSDYKYFKVHNSLIVLLLAMGISRVYMTDISFDELVKRLVLCFVLIGIYILIRIIIDNVNLKNHSVKLLGSADLKIVLVLIISLGFWNCMWVLFLGGLTCIVDIMLEKICLEKWIRKIPLGVFIFSGYFVFFALNIGEFKV